MSTAQQVIAHIDGHMQQSGVPNSGWYVGITSDVEQRLFTEHKVNKQNGTWAYATADTSAIARQVEQAYIKAGCKGGPGGGDATSRVVYAYVITASTAE
jgi:hypothetical protein